MPASYVATIAGFVEKECSNKFSKASMSPKTVKKHK